MSEINARIAREVMGWEVVFAPDGLPEGPFYLVDGSGFDFPEGSAMPVPDFEHSLDACAVAEAKLDDLGLTRKYYSAIAMMSPLEPAGQRYTWWLIRLTPAQRCAAMLAAIEAKP